MRNATRLSSLTVTCTSSSPPLAALLPSKSRSSSRNSSLSVPLQFSQSAEQTSLFAPRRQHEQVDVQVVATASATHFFDVEALEKEHEGRVRVWMDKDEWAVRFLPLFLPCLPLNSLKRLTLQGWNKIGDPVLHIEVRSSSSSVTCRRG
jgi:hypothetical protein